MFALALHSRRENERRANEKRRATIAAGRLHQRASQISLDDTAPKPTNKLHPTSNTDHGKTKGRSYSAITVIRTKEPEEILTAAGVSMSPSDQGEPQAILVRQSDPRVLIVRMTPEQHKQTAERLKRQLTQPNIRAKTPAKEGQLVKKLSK